MNNCEKDRNLGHLNHSYECKMNKDLSDDALGEDLLGMPLYFFSGALDA